MYRGKRTNLFMPLALSMLVTGIVACLFNAGLLGQANTMAAEFRALVLHGAGIAHKGTLTPLPWQLLMGVLAGFALLVAIAFCRFPWNRSILASAGLLGIAVGLSATVASQDTVDLPIAPFALVLVIFVVLSTVRGGYRRVRRGTPQAHSRRPIDAVVRHIIEHRILGIVTIGSRGMIGSMNPAAQVMLGYGVNDLSGTHVRHLFPQLFRDEGEEKRSIDRVLNVDGGAVETHAVRFGGDRIPVEITVTRLPVENGTQYSAFIRDLTVFRNQQQALEHQALHDSLTGLPNRTLFMRRLDEAIKTVPRRSKRATMAVLLLDLDRFKEVNNTLSHAVGDRALQALAERLDNVLPDQSTLSRLGGDEFAVLMPAGTDAATAQDTADRLRSCLQKSIDVDSIRLELDGSIGIALWPSHADSAAQLMQRADVAMYVAKQTPARVAVYDATQDENSLRRLMLSGDLRRAVNEGQLFLQYQPKVDLKTRRIAGVEALVRWRHPEYGAVPPDDFIEHAELTGAIVPLTQWVLTTAVERCAAWHAQGVEIDVAVNISARLLIYPDLIEMVRNTLAEFNLDAKHLVLEVTESALMADPERAQSTLSALKDLGVRLAIDDYGTGYSSLAYLSDLDADELKIDKRFVQFAADNPNDRTIVESTIQLAHNLGLKVVAEGMEDERAYRLLRRLGCEVGQGFYFAKPLDADDVMGWSQSPASGRNGRKPRKAKPAARGAKHRTRRAVVAAG